MDNNDRAGYGRAAVAAGTPDLGLNGDDLDGIRTDAADAIANILHYVAQAPDAHALDVLATARMAFLVEIAD